MLSSCHVSDIIFYPIKSLKGIHLNEAVVDDFGIQNDRRFMLIDEDNNFVTQRTCPKLSLIDVKLSYSLAGEINTILLQSDFFEPVQISIEKLITSNHRASVAVWGEWLESIVLDDENTETLSRFVGKKLRLAYMPESSFRQVDRQYFSEDKRVSFADGYPFLLVSESSVEDLNSRLQRPVPVTNFRPNIVIGGGISAYAEDLSQRVTIGDISFELVKPCSRCVMTTINENGQLSKDKEPLKTLSRYRRNEFGVCFGQNLVHLSKGVIRVGDQVSFE